MKILIMFLLSIFYLYASDLEIDITEVDTLNITYENGNKEIIKTKNLINKKIFKAKKVLNVELTYKEDAKKEAIIKNLNKKEMFKIIFEKEELLIKVLNNASLIILEKYKNGNNIFIRVKLKEEIKEVSQKINDELLKNIEIKQLKNKNVLIKIEVNPEYINNIIY